MKHVSGTILALALAAGCSGTLVRRGGMEPSLTQTIDAQIAKDDAFPWAARRPLTWADFRGVPPSESGIVAAETAYTLIHGTRCAGDRFEFLVVAAFRPQQSWVRHAILRTPADSARALRHEQTHFDLTEVHARRLRRYYAEVIAPCRISTSDLSSVADRIARDEKAAQAEYDAETENGRNAAIQARWDKDVAAQLAALAKFAR
jgi:hypothetical protein